MTMKKRLLALLLAGTMTLGLAACGETPGEGETADPGLSAEDLRVGLILVGDTADSYNKNHITGMEKACQALGLSFETQVEIRSNVKEDESAAAVIEELVEEGCQVVFANSFGHEESMVRVAAKNPKVQFCHATGFLSAEDDLDNTHNYFAKVHEARYLSGVAAGLKTQTDMLGYVAAVPLAEVISGFTAFYLGARSVNPDVTMMVKYTDSWSDSTAESDAAQALIDLGCDVLSHHTNTTAVAAAAETNGISVVGYNSDMVTVAPSAALVSVQVEWGAYYEYALKTLLEGGDLPQDWCGGYAEGACVLSPLNTAILAEGTQEAIEKTALGLTDGTVQVFSGPLYGADSEGDELFLAEGEFYTENETSSSPTFDFIVDGVTVLP